MHYALVSSALMLFNCSLKLMTDILHPNTHSKTLQIIYHSIPLLFRSRDIRVLAHGNASAARYSASKWRKRNYNFGYKYGYNGPRNIY